MNHIECALLSSIFDTALNANFEMCHDRSTFHSKLIVKDNILTGKFICKINNNTRVIKIDNSMGSVKYDIILSNMKLLE